MPGSPRRVQRISIALRARGLAPNTWAAACPMCGIALGPLAVSPPRICACGAFFDRVDGIWSMVDAAKPRARRTAVTRQSTHVAAPRRHGHASASKRQREWEWRADTLVAPVDTRPSIEAEVPHTDPAHSEAGEWVHARLACDEVERHLETLANRIGRSLQILDLGAGTGWLSHRLSLAGHSPIAVDRSLDAETGLGGAKAYPGAWPRVHADWNRLPLDDAQADAAVFFRSLDHSDDDSITVAEALRVIRPNGVLLVAIDTTSFGRERRERLAADLGVRWQRVSPIRQRGRRIIVFVARRVRSL